MTKFMIVVGETEINIDADKYSIESDGLVFYKGRDMERVAVFNSWKYFLINHDE